MHCSTTQYLNFKILQKNSSRFWFFSRTFSIKFTCTPTEDNGLIHSPRLGSVFHSNLRFKRFEFRIYENTLHAISSLTDSIFQMIIINRRRIKSFRTCSRSACAFLRCAHDSSCRVRFHGNRNDDAIGDGDYNNMYLLYRHSYFIKRRFPYTRFLYTLHIRKRQRVTGRRRRRRRRLYNIRYLIARIIFPA